MLANDFFGNPRGMRRQRTFVTFCRPFIARTIRFIMDYSFPRYLLSKQTVDDRALNKDVLNALRVNIPPEPVSIIEVGAGIGTMLKRLITWNIFCRGEYVLVDAMEENL